MLCCLSQQLVCQIPSSTSQYCLDRGGTNLHNIVLCFVGIIFFLLCLCRDCMDGLARSVREQNSALTRATLPNPINILATAIGGYTQPHLVPRPSCICIQSVLADDPF